MLDSLFADTISESRSIGTTTLSLRPFFNKQKSPSSISCSSWFASSVTLSSLDSLKLNSEISAVPCSMSSTLWFCITSSEFSSKFSSSLQSSRDSGFRRPISFVSRSNLSSVKMLQENSKKCQDEQCSHEKKKSVLLALISKVEVLNQVKSTPSKHEY